LEASGWLGIVGGVLEITGFGLVAVELVRAQRRELGTAGPFQFLLTLGSRLSKRLRRLFGRDVTIRVPLGVAEEVNIAERLKLRLTTQSEDLAQRVKVLESNFKRLEEEWELDRQSLEGQITHEAERREKALNALRADIDSRRDEDREAFAGSARLQWLGIGLFVLGAIASAMANVVGAS
jgi:hypothetical protein